MRVRSNGSLDTNFVPPAGINNDVRTLALQPDDMLLAGGAFTEVDHNDRDRIFRVDTDPNAERRAALQKKTRKIKKQIKSAKRKKQTSKVKKLTKSLKEILKQLRSL